MQIFVDADACPSVIKDILYRAAIRTNTKLILIANRYLHTPNSPLISSIIVANGFDEADRRIIDEVNNGDLVITSDIPLADLVISKSAIALNPRGTLYTKENIKHKLAMRDLMMTLRDNHIIHGGAAAFSQLDSKAFAKELDKILAATSIP